MTRRILAQHTGDSTHFGTIDGIDYINKLLTGAEDQSSSDPVDINTNFTITDQKLKIANPANTQVYTVATSTLSTSDKTITIPAITSDDRFVTIAFADTLTGKTINVPSGSGGTMSTVLGPDLMLYPSSYVRSGGNQGGSNTAGFGFCNGILTGTGTASFQLSATEGKFTRITTTTSVGSGAGTRGANGTGVIRALNPRFFCRFRLNDAASNARFYAGLQSTNSAFPSSGDDPLNALSGVLFGVKAADTTWQIINNEGTGATNFANASGSPSRDTNIHTIEIVGDEANTKWKYSFDGGSFVDVTTEIPASSTALYPLIWAQNAVAGTTRSMDQWHWMLQCTEPSIG